MGYWIDTFAKEKGYDMNEPVIVFGDSGVKNIVKLGEVIAAIKEMDKPYQDSIKKVIVALDFRDPNLPLRFIKGLAKALAF